MITVGKNLVDISLLSKDLCTAPILVELKYASADNFTGQPVEGYGPNAIHQGLLTKKAALALCEAQEYVILNYGCTLLVYDAYRPLRAVKHLAKWCATPEMSAADFKNKEIYYPNIQKNQIIPLGYLATDISSHCYGNTVDLVLADIQTQEPLNMGCRFDFFDPLSWREVDIQLIGADACRYRYILGMVMERFGFISYEKEYWHFEFAQREIAQPLDLIL